MTSSGKHSGVAAWLALARKTIKVANKLFFNDNRMGSPLSQDCGTGEI
jgi:hypothetical protein